MPRYAYLSYGLTGNTPSVKEESDNPAVLERRFYRAGNYSVLVWDKVERTEVIGTGRGKWKGKKLAFSTKIKVSIDAMTAVMGSAFRAAFTKKGKEDYNKNTQRAVEELSLDDPLKRLYDLAFEMWGKPLPQVGEAEQANEVGSPGKAQELMSSLHDMNDATMKRFNSGASDVTARVAEGMAPVDVIFSQKTRDVPLVRELAAKLQSRGVGAFFQDHIDATDSRHWRSQWMMAKDKASIAVCILSRPYLDSKACCEEWEVFSGAGRMVVAVDPPEELAAVPANSFNGSVLMYVQAKKQLVLREKHDIDDIVGLIHHRVAEVITMSPKSIINMLKDADLVKYAKPIEDEGYKSMRDLIFASESEIAELFSVVGMKKPEQRRIAAALKDRHRIVSGAPALGTDD